MPSYHFIRLLLWFTVGLLVTSIATAHAATLNVPSQFSTIQAAIKSAQDGDTVLIADGTYTGDGNRDIDFGGKNLTITSLHGAVSTIIECGGCKSTDGSSNHCGFYFHSGETKTVISGLTIKNGYEASIHALYDSGKGGGIRIDNSSATVQNCIITENTAALGGAVYIRNGGQVTLTKCNITNNTADNGGGVYNYDYGGTVKLTDCALTNNTADIGGGIANYNTLTLTNCILTGNKATLVGGGAFNINNGNGTIRLTNCTFTNNAASNGGGLYNFNSNSGIGSITLTNDILYGDTGGEIASEGGRDYNISNATATYCDVQGGYKGMGNIDADPLFVNAANDDLHLKPGSPSTGKGIAVSGVTTDKDGKTRGDPPTIGAYEGAEAILNHTEAQTNPPPL